MSRIELGGWGAWLVGAALLVPGWVAAASPSPRGAADPDAAGLEALKAAIGEPRCLTDASCWAVPIGSRPCGGPETYWPASHDTSDSKQVARLAEAWAATQRNRAQVSGRLGVCTVTPMPVMRCNPKARLCEAKSEGNVTAR